MSAATGPWIVVVVDDDPAVRDSLRMLLRSVGLQTAAYANAQEFLEAQDLEQVGCLILDVRLPGMGGLDLLETLRGRGLDVPVLVISGYGDVPLAVRAIKGGALDFLEKPFNPQQLLDRVHQALQEGQQRRQLQAGREEYEARLSLLTRREREVMELMAAGKSNKDIAIELAVSPKTLDIHRARVFHKMGVGNVAAIVSQAWRFARPGESPAATAAAQEAQPKVPQLVGPTPKPEKRPRGRPAKGR